jgi:hypothetical protein
MSDSSKLVPRAGEDPGPDALSAVDQFKRTPVRVGCLGCTLTGWMTLIAGIAVVLTLLFLIRRFGL